MKTSSKGFAIPLVMALVAIFAIGGGAYVHNKNKANLQADINADIHAGMNHDMAVTGSSSEPAVSDDAVLGTDVSAQAGVGAGVSASVGIRATSSPANSRRPAPPEANVSMQQQVTLQGEYVCLPHANTGGPQTMECALGLKADNGSYYALDLTGSGSNLAMGLGTGSRIKVTGLLVPVEALSSNVWQKYSIKGIIKASSAVKI